jgi:hypothetical protein
VGFLFFKTMKRIFFYVILAIAFVSCGGTAKQFVSYTHGEPLPNGKSRIYVMYKTIKFNPLTTMTLFSNEERIGTIEKNGYLAFDVQAGQEYALYITTGRREGYTWNGTAGDDHFRINAKEGKTYYLKLDPQNRTIGRVYNFELLDKTEGERILKKYSRPKLNYAE